MRYLALACVLTLAVSCRHDSPAPPEEPAQTLGIISAQELQAAQGLTVVHVVRTAQEFEEGHISGARMLLWSDLIVERDGLQNELPEVAALKAAFERVGVRNDTRVVTYSADPLLSGRALFTLEYLGHRNLAYLDGGVAAWRTLGGAMETGPATPATGEFTPSLQPELVVDAAWVNAHRQDASVALIDARPADQHNEGRIPGSTNIYWQTLLNAEGKLLPSAELKARFEAAGAAPGKTVVTYCRTGVQASVLYVVARYLGYTARMYDGSFTDWSARTELPVEKGP
jgi:thiosulfate/3-mercaptopyruvate sulfurtransferase